MKELNIKQKIKNLIIIGIPVAILAIIQMLYNYIRFGNILEFGAKYQLTAFNISTYMGISFSKCLIALAEYIFQSPEINLFEFPFITKKPELGELELNQFHYDNLLIGVAFIALFWIFLFKKYIYKDSKKLKWFVNISLITSIVLMCINNCMGGTIEAYSIDFKCILAIGATILLLKLVSMKKSSPEIKTLFIVISLLTLIIMIPLNLTAELEWFVEPHNQLTIFFKNIFEFWA